MQQKLLPYPDMPLGIDAPRQHPSFVHSLDGSVEYTKQDCALGTYWVMNRARWLE